MKKTIFVFILSLFTLMALSSCDQEIAIENPDELPELGTFNYDGISYKINTAAVIGYKTSDNSKPNIYTFQFVSVNGNLHRTAKLTVNFPFGEPIDGSFDLDDPDRILKAGLSSYTYTDGNFVEGHYNLVEGNCTVSRISENNFNVSFNMMPEDSMTVSGTFNGVAEVQESFY